MDLYHMSVDASGDTDTNSNCSVGDFDDDDGDEDVRKDSCESVCDLRTNFSAINKKKSFTIDDILGLDDNNNKNKIKSDNLSEQYFIKPIPLSPQVFNYSSKGETFNQF